MITAITIGSKFCRPPCRGIGGDHTGGIYTDILTSKKNDYRENKENDCR